MPTFVSESATIDDSAYIGNNVRIYGQTTIEKDCIIEDNVTVGKPSEPHLKKLKKKDEINRETYDSASTTETVIGSGSTLQTGTIIYEGCELGESVVTEDFVRIGWNSRIGSNCMISYRGLIYINVSIGENTKVAGFVCDNTVIEDDCFFFGMTSHEFPPAVEDPDNLPAPTIETGSIVGFGAQLIGGIRIGTNSYIGANAVVTKDVPDERLVVNNNEIKPREEW